MSGYEEFEARQRELVDGVITRGQKASRDGRGLRLTPEEVEALFKAGPLSEDIRISIKPS